MIWFEARSKLDLLFLTAFTSLLSGMGFGEQQLLQMEPIQLACANRSTLTDLHIEREDKDPTKGLNSILMRYLPLVDGLMKFKSHNTQCYMTINGNLRQSLSLHQRTISSEKQINKKSKSKSWLIKLRRRSENSSFKSIWKKSNRLYGGFKKGNENRKVDTTPFSSIPVFTYIDNVREWDCPGNFAHLIYFLESHQQKLWELGIKQLYFIVLATDRQFKSFHRLRNSTEVNHFTSPKQQQQQSGFLKIIKTSNPINLALPNPFQIQILSSQSSHARIKSSDLPICKLYFPDRVPPKLSTTTSATASRQTFPTESHVSSLYPPNDHGPQLPSHSSTSSPPKLTLSPHPTNRNQQQQYTPKIYEEDKSFFQSLDFLFHLRSLTLVAATITFTIVIISVCCVAWCWWCARRRDEQIKYQGLNHPTEDYDKSYYTTSSYSIQHHNTMLSSS